MGGRQSTTTTATGGTGSTATVSGPQGGGGRGPATAPAGSSAAATDGLQFSHGHHLHHHHQHHVHQSSGACAAAPGASTGGSSSSQSQRQRGGSSSAAVAHHRGFPVGIPASNGGAAGGALGSPGSDDSTPEDDPMSRAILGSAIPVHLFSFRDIKCPVCSKLVPPDDVECHFVMCLTRPRINYNEDVLLEDKDECAICFEELLQGDTIARLPCLCIYHKRCIDQWFKVKRSCPEHPND